MSSRHNYGIKRQIIFARDSYTCKYCHSTATKLRVNRGVGLEVTPMDYKGRPFEIDHITPYSKGGNNKLNNLVCACPDCNNKKSDKIQKQNKGFRLYKLFEIGTEEASKLNKKS